MKLKALVISAVLAALAGCSAGHPPSTEVNCVGLVEVDTLARFIKVDLIATREGSHGVTMYKVKGKSPFQATAGNWTSEKWYHSITCYDLGS